MQVKATAKNKHIVYLGIGSNIGDRVAYIEQAKYLLSSFSVIVSSSSLYETAPQEAPGIVQDNFLNIVLEVETVLSLDRFFEEIQKIEQALGRVREIKNGPRTIDIDILLYDTMVVEAEHLVVPHPRMHQRNFVLVPFAEIAPEIVHPIFKKKVNTLLEELDTNEWIQKYDI